MQKINRKCYKPVKWDENERSLVMKMGGLWWIAWKRDWAIDLGSKNSEGLADMNELNLWKWSV